MPNTIQIIKKIISNKLIENGYFDKQGKKKFITIMYHGIDKVQNVDFNPRFFSVTNFEEQIALFKKHTNVLTHDDLMNDRFSDTKLNVVITFDDGYLNNLKYALPILDKYGVHAYYYITGVGDLERKLLWADALDIVSVLAPQNSKVHFAGRDFYLVDKNFTHKETNTTLRKHVKQSSKNGYEEKNNLIDQLLSINDFTKKTDLFDYWQLMNNDEIALTARSSNITIGSHGFYHNNLGSLSNEDAIAEVMKSKNYLENIIQKDVTSIGFPDGSYTTKLNEDLYKLGFDKQFLVNYQFNDEGNKDYVYDRLGLYPYMGNPNQILHKTVH